MAPIADYGSEVGKAIIGGYVHRGSYIPAASGHAFLRRLRERAVTMLRYVEGEITYGPELVDELAAESLLVQFNAGEANDDHVVSLGGETYQFAMPGQGWATVKYQR